MQAINHAKDYGSGTQNGLVVGSAIGLLSGGLGSPLFVWMTVGLIAGAVYDHLQKTRKKN